MGAVKPDRTRLALIDSRFPVIGSSRVSISVHPLAQDENTVRRPCMAVADCYGCNLEYKCAFGSRLELQEMAKDTVGNLYDL